MGGKVREGSGGKQIDDKKEDEMRERREEVRETGGARARTHERDRRDVGGEESAKPLGR